MKKPDGMIWSFDFDGTLSHLVPDRNAAVLDPECEELLTDLARDSNHIVAVVSSRSLEDLKPRIKHSSIFLAGASGLEWWLPDGQWLGPNQQAVERLEIERQKLLSSLASIREIPGVDIEDKIWSLAVHFRKAAAADRIVVARELDNLHVHHGMALHYGPDVAEIQFLQEVSKEIAVKTLVKLFGNRKILYSGDDQNDAQAMRWVLDRKGIVYIVGDRISVTGANVVANPAELARALRRRFDWIERQSNYQHKGNVNG